MQHDGGDDYIRRTAAFIRDNERRLAHGGARRQKALSAPGSTIFNPLAWVGLADSGSQQQPVVLALDTHHLFYLLMRIEALGIPVGPLDVQIDQPSRPLAYIHLDSSKDQSDTLSIASFRSSFSAVSRLSLGAAWWGRPAQASVDAELKFIYRSFTYLPSLSIHAPGSRVIAELADDPPHNNAIPVDAFKNLKTLECLDIDPRALLGWDALAMSLRSLTIKRSGVDDPSSIFIDAVLDDQERRSGDAARSRRRTLNTRRPSQTFDTLVVPGTVIEEAEDPPPESEEEPNSKSLPNLTWAFLRHLSLSDNALTMIPTNMLNVLTSLTHLDLSSNLLVSVPSLSPLFNLISLNLSDNMIDSVLGIYKKLGSVTTLNLSHNRLDLLSGLERLMALERVDLRNNLLGESAEVGRLAILPNVSELWIEGNPFVTIEENYRIRCFDHFWREGKTITLDGSLPGYYERRGLSTLPSQQMYSSRTPPKASFSPPFAPAAAPSTSSSPNFGAQFHVQSPLSPPASGPSSAGPSPGLTPVAAKARRKRNKRWVALDGSEAEYRSSEDANAASPIHSQVPSNVRTTLQPSKLATDRLEPEGYERIGVTESTQPTLPPSPPPDTSPTVTRSRHSRSQTEAAPSSPSSEPQDPSSPIDNNLIQTFVRRKTGASRRARVSASVYEPSSPRVEDSDGSPAAKQVRDADAFRAKIEALRAEMGDNWLQVLSQSQLRDQPPKS